MPEVPVAAYKIEPGDGRWYCGGCHVPLEEGKSHSCPALDWDGQRYITAKFTT